MLERVVGKDHAVIRVFSHRIIQDGTNGDVELIRKDLIEYNDESFRVAFAPVTSVENEVLSVPVFNSDMDGTGRLINLTEYQLDHSGDFSLIRSSELSTIPAFDMIENRKGGFDARE